MRGGYQRVELSEKIVGCMERFRAMRARETADMKKQLGG
jgi:hypothetical protein